MQTLLRRMRTTLGAGVLVVFAASCGRTDWIAEDLDADAPCPKGQQLCGKVCANLRTDRFHCGECNYACHPGEVCSNGECALECGGSTPLRCGDACVDPTSNREHCGGCSGEGGETCGAGFVCVNSRCVASCPAGQVRCGNACVDPETDRDHCGASGNCRGSNAGKACGPGEVCAGGKCGTNCLPGQVLCQDRCVDPLTDRDFCGAQADCAGPNAGSPCGQGRVCASGVCLETCLPGQVLCEGKCVDTSTDRRYCGANQFCAGGRVCGPGQVCAGGMCQASCLPGQILCGTKCVDPMTDRTYCGAWGACDAESAGKTCAAGEVCSSGVCSLSCGGATPTRCGDRCVDIATDRKHCGGCAGAGGRECGPGEICSAGSCVLNCPLPTVACGTRCVDPLSDRYHCGARGDCLGANGGTACAEDEICQSGSCVSDETRLLSLVVTGGVLTPAFASYIETYTVSVFTGVSTLLLTPYPFSTKATVRVNGVVVKSGALSPPQPLALFGPTVMNVEVQAPSGSKRLYTLVALRSEAASVYVKASNTGAGDTLGYSLALAGDTLVVGAPNEDSSAKGVNGNPADNSAPNSGAVYVFRRNGRSWVQEAYIKASNTESGDRFGHSVAFAEEVLAVGAPGEDSSATGINGSQSSNAAIDSGAVYVFRRSGTTWTQEAYIKASNTGASDQFGHSVSYSAGWLAVGAVGEDSSATGINGNQTNNSASSAGAVYLFRRSGTTWTQYAYVKASNTEANDMFGHSVSISDDLLAVGAPGEDSAATGINGTQTNNSAADSGAVYLFRRSGTTTWGQEAYVKASNTGAGDSFGFSVAASSNAVAVGAYREDSASTGVNGNQSNNTATDSGAVYVFRRGTTSWAQEAYVKASNTDTGDFFGYSVALWGDNLAVGAVGEDSHAPGVNGNQSSNSASSSGAVYLFSRSGTLWSQQAYVKASNPDANDSFGFSVARTSDLLAVGAYMESSSATWINGNQLDNSAQSAGAVYLFE